MRTLLSSFAVLVAVLSPCVAHASDGAAGPDQNICSTATVLSADALEVGQTGFWTVISGSAVLGNDGSPICQVTQLSPGENVFQWTILGVGPPEVDQVIVTVYDPAATVANAGPDSVLCLPTDAMQLMAVPPAPPAIGSWASIGVALIEDPTDPHSFVEFPSGGSVQMIWTVFNGTCGQVSDTALVSVEACVIGMQEVTVDEPRLVHDQATRSLLAMNAAARSLVEVIDQSGRTVMSHQLTADGRILLPVLRPGIYTASLRAGDRVARARFVVER